jgi:Fe-S-cluster-containing dehydrogenase component
MAVILALVVLDTTRPTGCQVCAVSCVQLLTYEPDDGLLLESEGLGNLHICE